jgi:queuine/archaeosine tRNA-ribosyltransferase
MSCLITELGRLVSSQDKLIHDIATQLDSCDPDSRQYDYLESHLNDQVLIKDRLLDLIESIVDQDC